MISDSVKKQGQDFQKLHEKRLLRSILAPCTTILTVVLAAAAPILPSIHAHRRGLSLGYRYTRGC
jgi:hypothetical protein